MVGNFIGVVGKFVENICSSGREVRWSGSSVVGKFGGRENKLSEYSGNIINKYEHLCYLQTIPTLPNLMRDNNILQLSIVYTITFK